MYFCLRFNKWSLEDRRLIFKKNNVDKVNKKIQLNKLVNNKSRVFFEKSIFVHMHIFFLLQIQITKVIITFKHDFLYKNNFAVFYL